MSVKLMTAALPLLLTTTTLDAENSKPQPLPITDTIPAARDIPYPGTMTLDIDATDTARAIFRVKQTIPVAEAGPMVLLYPKWLPGAHSPRGEIEKLAGLKISANGKPIAWTRDSYDVYAFHIDVPRGARTIELAFQFISATAESQGRIVMTPAMLNLQWNSMSLYPAGYFTRGIPVQATVTYPAGWTAASGLPSKASGSTYSYQQTDYETLVDSPVFAGRYFRQDQLAPDVRLNIVADSPEDLAATPAQIDAHKRLIDQAGKLFGAHHYDKYEFLLSLSDEMGGIGLEHHRSSEDGTDPDYFTKWDDGPGRRNLLAHEYVHSWNGKFRRPAGLWTPDYRTPMKDDLLWVYEGQTQFWGYVLGARSGLFTRQETLDALASVAATLDTRPGEAWRPLADTTLDPVIAQRRPKGWLSYQRSEDYYNEGMLVWLEVDALLREQSGGAKSMDDFARAFFGQNDRDWGVVTYDFDDVVATLNGIVPYDWAGYLTRELTEAKAGAPLDGFTKSGYMLAYTDEQTAYMKDAEKRSKGVDVSYAAGFSVDKTKKIGSVVWDGPAFKAGLTIGPELIAVGGLAYSPDVLKEAITAAKDGKDPIRLTIKDGERYRDIDIDWHAGLRYPRFRKSGGDGGLDRLLAPK